MRKLIILLCAAGSLAAFAADTSVNTSQKWAWGESTGWINCRPTVTNGFRVDKDYCSGYIYSKTTGWINMGDGSPSNGIQYSNTSSSDFGVNHDGSGNLAGYAWSESTGWINFETNGAPKISFASGIIDGHAWSESMGWINFSNLGAHVKSDFIEGLFPICNITATQPQNGSITPAGTIQLAYGVSTNYTVGTNTYYSVSDVLFDSNSVGSVTSYSYTNTSTGLSDTHTISATIAAKMAVNTTPEWWLASYGLPVTDAAALLDGDGDGWLNWQEYDNGTYPNRKGPPWWYTRSIVNTNSVTTNDYAMANWGQLKWMATNAYTEMKSRYTDVSPAISNIVEQFTLTNNYYAVNVGQVKYVTEPFYDFLLTNSYGTNYNTNYPWTTNTVSDDYDYAPVNIGQLKKAFDFTLPAL